MFPDDWIAPLYETALAAMPDGVEVFDAHTHIGRNDPDGFTCEPEQLLEGLDRLPGRSAVFPMHEPAGYPEANDRVIEEAGRSDGRLVPFCRLDPAQDPLGEAQRSLGNGAMGIKLHPRAEQFQLATPELREVFALADERRLPVLVHAGRGIPALGRHAVEVCSEHPGVRLILAHAGICDLSWIWRSARELPNLYFDTAWWSPDDLLALFSLVPPGQVLFGSDAPYGTPRFAAASHFRFALQVGLSDEQLTGMAGGQMARLVAGEDPLDLGPAPGTDGLPNDPLLNRAYTFLVSAVGQLFNGVDAEETLALAELACDVPDDAPQAPVCQAVLGLLALRHRIPELLAQAGAPAEPEETGTRRSQIKPAVPLAITAAGLCRTPDVPLPDSRFP